MAKHKNIEQLHQRISNLARELHTQAHQDQTPQGRALLETSAEVMEGMTKAFDHFLAKSEEAWKN
jgi:hypothetical protein